MTLAKCRRYRGTLSCAGTGQGGRDAVPSLLCTGGFCLQSRRGGKKIRISNFWGRRQLRWRVKITRMRAACLNRRFQQMQGGFCSANRAPLYGACTHRPPARPRPHCPLVSSVCVRLCPSFAGRGTRSTPSPSLRSLNVRRMWGDGGLQFVEMGILLRSLFLGFL